MSLRNTQFEDRNDDPFLQYMVVAMLQFGLKLDLSFKQLISDTTILADIISQKFTELYVLMTGYIEFYKTKLLCYIMRPVPDLKS